MKVIDLYDAANECGLLDEEVEDVLPFAEMFSFADRKIGVCGCCYNRNTKDCPYPHDCKPMQPACLSFGTNYYHEP